jgi:hypothetical protein
MWEWKKNRNNLIKAQKSHFDNNFACDQGCGLETIKHEVQGRGVKLGVKFVDTPDLLNND